MLGVRGAKSFSGFMVAAPGAPWSSAAPQPAAARAAPGAREVCGSALPPAPAHGPRSPGPICLAPPPRAALEPRPGLRPRPRAPSSPTAHATRSRPVPAVLKGQRPCYSDHMTPQQLPPSASRTHPSPATPQYWPLCLAPPRKTPPPLCPPLPEARLLSGACIT